MFFILSKILYFVIMPINWLFGLMLYSLFAKKRSRKRKALVIAVVLGLLLTNKFIYNQVVSWWEVETITADQIDQPYDIGILLGGYSSSDILPGHDRLNFSHRGNRFYNAYELYRTGKVKKLLLTGGTGSLISKRSEAPAVAQMLMRIGVPESDIIIEGNSRNTWENALFTKQILDDQYPGASCLLMTSAYHMRRSISCYEKAGVKCTPFSVDYLAKKHRWIPGYLFLPDRMGFYYWEILIKEWVGYIAYYFSGYM